DDGRRRRYAAAEIVHEPIIIDAKTQQPPVEREVRMAFCLRRSRDLCQSAARYVTHENIPIADEGCASAGAIVNRGSVGVCHGWRIHNLILAAGGIDTMQNHDLR